MKYRLLYNWSFGRALRILLGTTVAVQGFLMDEYLLGAVGGLIGVMALFGYNTCGARQCTVSDGS